MLFKNNKLRSFRAVRAMRAMHTMALHALCVAPWLIGSVGHAQAASEYDVKAAFIFNFMRFTEWPDEVLKDNNLRLCILGRDSFGEAINALQGRQVQKRELHIRRVASATEAQSCHAVYIAPSEEPRLATVLATFAAKSVLTLSDIERFADKGGIIGLALVDERVRFEVNLATARVSGLRVNSQVLKLAQRVIDGKGTP